MLFAQNNIEIGYPLIDNYSAKEYGADTQNWAIVQDDRGVIYFGNNAGLLEYDGADWRLYPMLKNSTIRSLAMGPDGKIFAGGMGDLGYYQADSLGKLTFRSLMPYVPENNRDFSDVWQIFIHDDKAYFNADKYILILDIQKNEFKAIQGNDNFHLLFLVDGALYAREWGKGLQVLQGDSLSLVKGGEMFADERIYVMLPFPGAPGTSLIVTRTMGLFKYDGAHFTPFKTEADDYIKQNLIYLPGLILDDGNILLGTLNDGAVIIDSFGNIKQMFNRKCGISSPVVYYQLQDKAGAIWLTTDNGISRIDYASQVSYFDSRNNFSTTAHQLIRHKGRLYTATNNGVYYLDPKSSEFQQIKNGANQSVAFLKVDDDLLVGTLDGLFKIENFLLKPVRLSEGSEYDVNVLVQSKYDPNRIFVGAVGLWSIYKTKNGWVDEGQILEVEDIVNSIEEESDGTLWAASNVSGLFHISFQKDKNGKMIPANHIIEKIDARAGLPDGDVSVKKVKNEIYFLSDDNFFKYDKSGQKFYLDDSFGVVSSLPNYLYPNNIEEDETGRLWISMGREPALGIPDADGAYRWLKAPFKRFANEIIVSIFPENERVVWFSTASSIIKYNLTKSVDFEEDYPALIRRVEIQSDSTLYYGGATGRDVAPKIKFKNNSINFTFAATSFADVTATQYSTFLEGYDEKWAAWEKANKKEYTNLSPGRYTFFVKAKNAFDIESRKASYSFDVLSPWYRTWPAYVFYVLILGAGIYIVDRFQRRRLLAKEKERLKIQQAEHRAEVAELEASMSQAENERKSKELEEARQLQLAMLPKELPQCPNLEIATFMKTSTEVGGDYYDFNVNSNGALTAVIGDATGHGLKAGMMVTATKSLFESLAAAMEPAGFLRRANSTIKQMHLGTLKMALAMIRIDDRTLTLSSAGMPPILIFHKATQDLEEINCEGMPLGSLAKFPYQSKKRTLFPGDKIVLMSDGFPEQQNPAGEMLDYPAAYQTILESSDKSPQELVEHLVQKGDDWADGRPQDDDVTFVVIEVK